VQLKVDVAETHGELVSCKRAVSRAAEREQRLMRRLAMHENLHRPLVHHRGGPPAPVRPAAMQRSVVAPGMAAVRHVDPMAQGTPQVGWPQVGLPGRMHAAPAQAKSSETTGTEGMEGTETSSEDSNSSGSSVHAPDA
jgi:hypothetical protein